MFTTIQQSHEEEVSMPTEVCFYSCVACTADSVSHFRSALVRIVHCMNTPSSTSSLLLLFCNDILNIFQHPVVFRQTRRFNMASMFTLHAVRCEHCETYIHTYSTYSTYTRTHTHTNIIFRQRALSTIPSPHMCVFTERPTLCQPLAANLSTQNVHGLTEFLRRGLFV